MSPLTGEKRRAYWKSYYEANKERILAKNRAWVRNNWERALEISRDSHKKIRRLKHEQDRDGTVGDTKG